MKKIFSVFAAILFAGSMMATDVTVTVNAENAAEVLGQGSYGSIKDAPGEVTIDGLDFVAYGICRNANNTPSGYAASQLIQMRKTAAGYFMNKEALQLKSLVVIVDKAENIEISVGTDADDLSPVTLSPVDNDIQLLTYVNKQVGDPETVTYKKVEVNLSDKNFVKVGASGATVQVFSAVITYEDKGSAVENIEASAKAYKTIYNGQVVIVRDGVRYNTVGQVVE